jgi:hypothetical protein
MESRECSTCHFSKEIKGSDWVECRRYPPTGASSSISGFPTSPRDGWCGEYVEGVVVTRYRKRDEQWT